MNTGFTTWSVKQEEAERWAENMEFLADQRKEERLLKGFQDRQDADSAWLEVVALPEYQKASAFLQPLVEAAFKNGFLRARGYIK